MKFQQSSTLREKLLNIYYLVSIVGFFGVVLLVTHLYFSSEKLVDNRTKELCWWYASQNHEKEFTPERWQLIKELWTVEQWYDSCLNHHRYPVQTDLKK